MKSLKETIMKRDNLSEKEADDLIKRARNDLYGRFEHGEQPDDICSEWFGLEPDYIMDLM